MWRRSQRSGVACVTLWARTSPAVDDHEQRQGAALVVGGNPAHIRRHWLVRALFTLSAIMALAWALVPTARGLSLVANRTGRGAPDPHAAGIPVREIHFTASDGIALAGWLAIASPDAPTVILVHGFKGNRLAMLPWARYLYAAGYNTLLYDSRGCGESAGWGIGVGATEPNDIIGATRYLQALPDLRDKRFAALGVSLGAGDVILAAARDSSLRAVIADSPWADERPQLDRMGSLTLGPLAIPLLPYEPALVDALIGARLEDARPAGVAGTIAPRVPAAAIRLRRTCRRTAPGWHRAPHRRRCLRPRW